MKQSVVAFLLIIPLFLGSCSGNKTKVTPVMKGISFSSVITYYDETYALDAVIEKEGKAAFSFTAPETLTGLTLIFEEDTVSAEYAELRHKWNAGDNDNRAATETIFLVFRDAWESKTLAVLKENNFLLTGKTAGMPYTVYLGATGLPISLEMNDAELHADFQNVTVL